MLDNFDSLFHGTVQLVLTHFMNNDLVLVALFFVLSVRYHGQQQEYFRGSRAAHRLETFHYKFLR